MSLLMHECQTIINKAIADKQEKELMQSLMQIIDWQDAVISSFTMSIPDFWRSKAEAGKEKLFKSFQEIIKNQRGDISVEEIKVP